MELAQFWKLIDEARNSSVNSEDSKEDFITHLEEALTEGGLDEIVSFNTHLLHQFHRTFHWDIIGAAVVIFGTSCTESDIRGFRCWLISQGEDFLSKSIQEVDWLGDQDLLPNELQYAGLLRLPQMLHAEFTGEPIPLEDQPTSPENPEGIEFQVKELPGRFPKLASDFAFVIG